MTEIGGGDKSEGDRQKRLISAAFRNVHDAPTHAMDPTSLAARLASADVAPEIPGFEIHAEIHRGGQGVVYRAWQKSTQRTVAIKVMREGPFASSRGRALFEREVYILGQLRHPNIVAVHDSGVVAGNSYFVMDYIDGLPLDEHVRSRRLPLLQILKLLLKVCHAVNAAHLRGVIHRDLKPGNIRVDHSGEPYVLDFGLAKPTELALGGAGESSFVTAPGQFVGSMPWASPEQAAGKADQVDLRTDVYALGVVFFQLITGEFPYQVTGSAHEVLDQILHAAPIDPRKLNRAIDDEIATIVLKCLHKEPERRYQSAGNLARDLERYLRDEPIEARRDSLIYLLGKRLKRHRLAAGVAAAFGVVVTAALLVSLSAWRQADLARIAEARQREIAQENADRAQREAQIAQAVNAFLNKDLLAAVAPSMEAGRGRDVRMREVLDVAARRIEQACAPGGRFHDKPLVEVAIRDTLGTTYRLLGEYDLAAPHLERALALTGATVGDDDPSALNAMTNLALLRQDQRRLDEAEALARNAVDKMRALQRDDNPNLATAIGNLGLILLDEGRFGEAEPLLREAFERSKSVRGETDDGTLTIMGVLGTAIGEAGRHAEAEAILREVVRLRREAHGDDDADLINALNNLASVVREQGRIKEAASLQAGLLDAARRVYGEDHPATIGYMNNLGGVYYQLGEYERSRALYEETLKRSKRVLGPLNDSTLRVQNNLAGVYEELGQADLALPMYLDTLASRRQMLGNDHADTLTSINNLAVMYRKLNRLEDAEPLFREAAETAAKTLGEAHPQALVMASNLGDLYNLMERYDEGGKINEQVLAKLRGAVPPGHWVMGMAHLRYGKSLLGMGHDAEAEALLLEAAKSLESSVGPARRHLAECVEALVGLYERRGDTDEAARWRRKLNEVGADS